MNPLFPSGNYVCLKAFMVDITQIIICCHTVGSWVKFDILEEHDASIFRMIQLGVGGYWVIVYLDQITTDGQSGQIILRAYDQKIIQFCCSVS